MTIKVNINSDSEYSKMLSPTALSLKIRCGLMYYYEKILKLPKEDEDRTALIFGSMTHSILEHFYYNIDEEEANLDSYQHFTNIMEVLKQKYWDYELPQTKEKELDSIIQMFVEKQSGVYNRMLESGNTDNFYPLAVEDDITSKTYNIRSIVDRINKNFTIGDYKTTKRFPELLLSDPDTLSDYDRETYDKEILSYQIQAVMNAMCIEDKYGKIPSMMIFIFVRHLNNKEHGGLLPIEMTQEVINKVRNLINIHSEEINKEIFLPTSDRTNCNKFGGCPYKEHCESEHACFYLI